ncbi:MAG: hypothetical protein HY329_04545, partial [Chloroflexi bacterium]|nr:hypothetical protein [Chloroflexota bacterium]
MSLKQHLKSGLALIATVGLLGTACTTSPVTAVLPITVQQASIPPTAARAQAPAAPTGGLSAPAPGPNLLAKTWPERLGIIVSDLQPATGKPVLNPKPGDLWFFSNSSTTWGA